MLPLLMPLLMIVMLGLSSSAIADDSGFQLNRFEPSPAGEFFFGVDHPWYSPTRYFAGGLTLDYSHHPLVYFPQNGGDPQPIVEGQLVGHVDLAGSFWNRVQLSVTLPVTLYESGNDLQMLLGTGAKAAGFTAGDPRVGVMFRIFGDPRTDAFTLHVGAYLWIPIGTDSDHAGDHGVRVLPKLVMSGLTRYIRWSFTAAFLYRGDARIGTDPNGGGNNAGNELQLAAAIGYVTADRRLTAGPETNFATLLSPGGNAFNVTSALEVGSGFNYLVKDVFLIGAWGGGGIFREAGTPDARALVRVAYAPQPALDTDRDGIPDGADACPAEPGVRDPDANQNGCPPRDRDQDGVADHQDRCPDEPQGDHPDPERPGCLASDTDADGVCDYEDVCPEIAQGQYPDPNRRGCPLPDRDGDGVLDADDVCPDVPMGPKPDPTRRGCPAIDRDGDGVHDYEDVCPDVPAGAYPDPDPAGKGCPERDRDKDSVPDSRDACPGVPGAPNPDPKKNGCPGLVIIKNGMIVILQPVFFATDKDLILPKSFPLLQAVANVFAARSAIQKVEIQGHSDTVGKMAHNMELSDRRAKSVMSWLVAHGVAPDRMQARGYGPLRPVAFNTTNAGRAQNRRVEFHILDPAQDGASGQMRGPPARQPRRPSPTPADRHRGRRHRHDHHAIGHAGSRRARRRAPGQTRQSVEERQEAQALMQSSPSAGRRGE